MAALRSKPGIYVERVTPEEPAPLPRMDIALFAGFTSKGRIEEPVPVESVSDYEDAFGATDLEIGRIGDSVVRANLGPSVRAFFRNGGERCWVLPLQWGRFTDSRLESRGTGELRSEAEHILFTVETKLARESRNRAVASPPNASIAVTPRLAGIHGALPLTEASILCVPDAVFAGWTKKEAPTQATPVVTRVPRQVSAEGAGGTFSDCLSSGTLRPEFKFELLKNRSVGGVAYFTGEVRLSWTGDGETIVEESEDERFLSPTVIYKGTRRTIRLRNPHKATLFYRTGASDLLRIEWPGVVAADLEPSGSNDDLLRLHVQMLRICAARGDMFAVLTLPRSMRENTDRQKDELNKYDLNNYLVDLTKAVASEGPTESADPADWSKHPNLSYGAVYHPWLVAREENRFEELTTSPPDGAVAGVMAARSLRRGPWIAPANEALRGVVSVDPEIRLPVDRLNVIERDPAGFMALSEVTLCSKDDFTAIHVRRLMMLLRRLALREGAAYVFEPNNDVFRRSVQRGFERVLEKLFTQGAFAGDQPRRAFRVSTESHLNTPHMADLGRFFVELKVAPSRETQFIVLRLVQTADRLLLTEGA